VKIGVVALQGGFRPHAEALSALDVETVEVRLPRDLAQVEALAPVGKSRTPSTRTWVAAIATLGAIA